MLGREMASAAMNGWLWLGDAAQVWFSMGRHVLHLGLSKLSSLQATTARMGFLHSPLPVT